MVPSRGGTEVLKVMDLTEVSDIGNEKEEPEGEGRGKGRKGEDLKGSNGEHAEVKRRNRPALCDS